jgi:hypothetical protein
VVNPLVTVGDLDSLLDVVVAEAVTVATVAATSETAAP